MKLCEREWEKTKLSESFRFKKNYPVEWACGTVLEALVDHRKQTHRSHTAVENIGFRCVSDAQALCPEMSASCIDPNLSNLFSHQPIIWPRECFQTHVPLPSTIPLPRLRLRQWKDSSSSTKRPYRVRVSAGIPTCGIPSRGLDPQVTLCPPQSQT